MMVFLEECVGDGGEVLLCICGMSVEKCLGGLGTG